MSSPSASDDVGAAVAIQVGGDSIFAGHAAVVDGMPLENERVLSQVWGRTRRLPVRADRPCRACWGRAGRSDQLVVVVVIQIGGPDGVPPLHWLGDHLPRPEL